MVSHSPHSYTTTVYDDTIEDSELALSSPEYTSRTYKIAVNTIPVD